MTLQNNDTIEQAKCNCWVYYTSSGQLFSNAILSDFEISSTLFSWAIPDLVLHSTRWARDPEAVSHLNPASGWECSVNLGTGRRECAKALAPRDSTVLTGALGAVKMSNIDCFSETCLSLLPKNCNMLCH